MDPGVMFDNKLSSTHKNTIALIAFGNLNLTLGGLAVLISRMTETYLFGCRGRLEH